jgi:hypothetical protein
MTQYKLNSTVTARTQNGNDAGKIPASVPPFESVTAKVIRDMLHRKIESGQYLNLYVPALACDEVTTQPPDPDPDPEPVESPFISATLTRADGTTVEFIPKV